MNMKQPLSLASNLTRYTTTSRSLFGVSLAFLLSSSAHAADAAKTDFMGSGALGQILMLLAFGVIFYFLILRPQSKRAKQQRDLITNLQKGDEIVTAGGIAGKINRVTDNFFVLMIAEGTEVVIQKNSIAGSLPKGTLKNI